MSGGIVSGVSGAFKMLASCSRLDKGRVYISTVNESSLTMALDPYFDGHGYLILMGDWACYVLEMGKLCFYIFCRPRNGIRLLLDDPAIVSRFHYSPTLQPPARGSHGSRQVRQHQNLPRAGCRELLCCGLRSWHSELWH